jgi:hypothetical protein
MHYKYANQLVIVISVIIIALCVLFALLQS